MLYWGDEESESRLETGEGQTEPRAGAGGHQHEPWLTHQLRRLFTALRVRRVRPDWEQFDRLRASWDRPGQMQ